MQRPLTRAARMESKSSAKGLGMKVVLGIVVAVRSLYLATAFQ